MVSISHLVMASGVVAFCPLNACSPLTARRIGVLQPFYVKSMPMPGDETQMVVVEDAKIARTIRRVSHAPAWGGAPPAGLSPYGGLPKPR